MAENDPVWVESQEHVICLDIDDATLKQRIAGRQDNDFGKSSHEFDRLIKWSKVATQKYRQNGALVVDATQPLGEVVSQVLNYSRHLQAK